jgi:hypothetical protein
VNFQRKPVLAAVIAAFTLMQAEAAEAATEKQELLELKNTIVNLVDALVAQGVLTGEQAETLKRDAAAKARVDAAKIAKAAPVEEPVPADAPGSKVVRVPYVPEFVKEEIREQVREELRADVANDVIAKAKEERWGVKDALPGWVNTMTFYGDFRLRNQQDFYASDNLPSTYPDFMAINDAGGITRAGGDTFLNTTEDQNRLRFRVRFGFDSIVAEDFKVGVRLVTGNEINPVSFNETLGRSGKLNGIFVERAFLSWQDRDASGLDWVTLTGGRMNRPFFSTDLVWDNDLMFEGVTAHFRQSGEWLASLAGLDGGDLRKTHLGTTIGIYPVLSEELAFPDDSSNDKWLWGAQLNFDHAFQDESLFTLGLAYYDYINIFGQRNAFGSSLKDWTAPEFSQKGNTVFDIRNDNDLTTELFALASDFTLLNLTASFDYAGFAPTHVIVTGDVVKNLGYDESAIERRTGARIEERSLGYAVGLRVGRQQVLKPGDWAVFTQYRYLQRDAVVDAFTDSNFHLGGTDSKGYIIGTEFGFLGNSSVMLRWFSADEIDGAPLGIDTLQADLNARF